MKAKRRKIYLWFISGQFPREHNIDTIIQIYKYLNMVLRIFEMV